MAQKTKTQTADTASKEELQELLEDKTYLNIPNAGDAIKGTVISVSRNEVRVNIDGYGTGIVRGKELTDPSREFSEVEPGDEVEATVIDIENENGEVELSFRFAGHMKAWDRLKELFRTSETAEVKVTEASKGGLLVKLNHISGFLPVSQLAPDNYPRVAGGDKSKILDKLKSFVGQAMEVKVIDANDEEEKLIVSEKAVWEDKQKSIISKFQVGDIVEGEVSALADFGAFVKFDILEGLVHISEIAWQRIDHPSDLLKVGDKVKAEIIGIEGSKIFLSMKKLVDDPWKNVHDKYRLGQKVKGTVLKINPFGFFVELDPDIHGLAHISELSDKPVSSPEDIAKSGQEMEFIVVSIEPEQHRLGLSLKALDEGTPAEPKPGEPAEGSEDAPESPLDGKKEEEKETPAEESGKAEEPSKEEAPAEKPVQEEEQKPEEQAAEENKKEEAPAEEKQEEK